MNIKYNIIPYGIIYLLFLSYATSAQTLYTQTFGAATGTYNTSGGTSTLFLPAPTNGGTTFVAAGNTGGSIILANPGVSGLGSGSQVQAVAGTGSGNGKVTKVTPITGYTANASFYTEFYILLGNSSGASSATATGDWEYYQGTGATLSSNTTDYNSGQTFCGLQFAFSSGSINLSYITGGTWNPISTCLAEGVVYKVEIFGNNSASTEVYDYGTAQSCTSHTYDVWINGNKVGDNLTGDGLSAGSTVNALSFFGRSSAGNLAYMFLDNVSVYNQLATVSPNCSAPTTAASSISFAGTTGTTTNMNWTNGNGGNRIVVVEAGSSVAGTPSNGTTYSANAAFGSGGTIATGQYVVYNNCSNTVSISALTAGTTYAAAVFEYNCNSGNETFLTTGVNSYTFTTIPNTPGSFATDCGSSGNINLSWTNSGNYDGILIFARQGSSPSYTPSGAGSGYTGANNNFSSATTYGTDKLVYSGTGTSASISGLTAGLSYSFRVIAYTASTYSAFSSVVSQLSGVPNVSGVSVSAAVGSLTVSWTNPASCFDSVLVIATDNSSVSSVPSGWASSYYADVFYHDNAAEIGSSNEYVVYNGTGTSVQIFGLINGTTYNIKVYVENSEYWSTGVTTSGVPTNSNGDFRTRPVGIPTTGNWSGTSTWQIYNSGTSTWSNTSSFPSSSTASVTIQNDYTVVLDAGASNAQAATLTVESGGKLYTNSTTTQNFVSIYSQVICDGTIGNGSTNDGISLSMEGATCFIGGSGTCNIAALEKNTSTNSTSSVTINMNINFYVVGGNYLVMSNNQTKTTFDVTINAGSTVSTPPTLGNVATAPQTNPGAKEYTSYTVYGTLEVNGIFYMTSDNAQSGGNGLDIKAGGEVYVDSIMSGGGKDLWTLTVESGGWLNIYGAGFYSFSTSNITYALNTGSLVEYSGSSAQTVESGLTYANLKYSGSGNKTMNTDGAGTLAVNGTLTVTGSANFNSIKYNNKAYVLSTAGDITLVSGGTFNSNCLTELNITTNSATGTQTFTGNSQSIMCDTLTSTKTGGSLTFASSTNLTLGDDLVLNYSSSALFSDGGNTFYIGDDLDVGGSSSTSSNFSFTGTVVFVCSDASTTDHHISNAAATGVTPAYLNNVTLLANSGVTNTAANLTIVVYPTGGGQTLYINGNLSINNSNSLSNILKSDNNTIQIAGNWSNYAATGFTQGTGQVIFAGSGAQSITGATTFYNLKIDNTGSGVTLNNTIITSNLLTLTLGVVTTGSNQLQVTNANISSIAGYSKYSYIYGNLLRSVNSTGSYDFPVGDNVGDYELATLNLTSSVGISTILGFFTPGLPATLPNPNTCSINGSHIGNMLNAGFWTLTPNAYTSVNYDITLNETGYTGFSGSATELGVIKRHDATQAWAGTGVNHINGVHTNATQSISNGIAIAKRTSVPSFSDYGIGYGNTTLPITLDAFDAKAMENKMVNVNWSTASEINSNYFSIERSSDAINFEQVGTVAASGNTITTHSYEFTDYNPLIGTSYYRLREIDTDDSSHISGISAVVIYGDNIVSIYPNPTPDVLNVKLNNNDLNRVTITGIDGKLYLQQTYSNQNGEINLNVSQLTAGIYSISIDNGTSHSMSKFIKQ